MIQAILYWRKLSLVASGVKDHFLSQQHGQLVRGLRKKDTHNLWVLGTLLQQPTAV